MAIHDAGDIAWADLGPVRGTEQGDRRPALILTSRDYNEKSGRAIICPISSKGAWPFNVPMPDGLTTRGLVLVDQVRAVHYASRVFRRIETAPAQLVLDVHTMLVTILGMDVEAVVRRRDDI